MYSYKKIVAFVFLNMFLRLRHLILLASVHPFTAVYCSMWEYSPVYL